ncbi:hypothetical protein EG68_01190 [Paragonimus skrjabini miyazakii]|uniref:Uncharacterized protein n=2 Tax=Paragonimus TaxID=34503 RepID=A0A8S9ZC90_9TREM|nr:hypothetical protein EG68_01190 [Paragonimus skrjabini miyazakii]
MAPAKISNLRGESVSPNVRPYDTSVIKVGGEVFDRDGYRMDVTVWFRHRNEVLFCSVMMLSCEDAIHQSDYSAVSVWLHRLRLSTFGILASLI